MKKEKIFSKFNISNFNNDLEEVLSFKPFSENVKNNILNMIYKIEEAYNDYKKVKIEAPNKKEFLENILKIVKENCNEIHILPTNKLQEKQYIIDYERGSIKVSSNYVWILYSIFKIVEYKRIFSNNELDITQNKPIYDFLKLGYNLNKIEVIRDFNGWSWISSLNEIKDINVNLIYQNLQLLIGNKFMENYYQNIITNENEFLIILKNELQKKYNKEIAENIIDLFTKISIIEISNIDEEYRENILKIKQQKFEEYSLMDNKREYLQSMSLIKKNNIEKIKNIDKLINNPDLLKQEYKSRNSLLKNSEKIFSVSCLVEILNQERQEALEKITDINNLMDPKKFIRKKLELENDVNKLAIDKKNSDEYIIEFQKLFIRCLKKNIEICSEKADIIDTFYKVRYYINCLIDRDKYIKDAFEIKEEIIKLKENIAKKLIENNLIFDFSSNKDLKEKILINILDTRIINLQAIYIILKKDKKEVEIEVYDEDELYKVYNIEIKENESEEIKLGKKIKLFL
ncbi:MAG: hypothetical protein IKT41_03470 [Clostridia bacterium]|nr:hypothetical protein [Clostridia bacterium]